MSEYISVNEFARRLVDVFPQVMRGVMRRQTDALTKGQITAPQFLVLDLIYRLGPQKMGVLAETLSVSLPAASGLVDRLHKLGLVERVYEEKDRRIIRIELKPRGKSVVKTFRLQREKIIAEIFGQLSENDRNDYLRILIKIKDIINKK